MSIVKYSRTYENLNTVELHCLLKHYDSEYDEKKNYINTKADAIKIITSFQNDFNKASNVKIYYFSRNTATASVRWLADTGIEKNEYPLSSNPNKNKIVNNSAIGESAQINENDILLKSPDQNQSRKSNRFGNLKFKCSYQEDRGVESFFKSVERYCSANNIHLDTDKITISINGLIETEAGEMATDSLSERELLNFELFKASITQSLGKNNKFHKNNFSAFKRKSGETLRCAFNRLISIYKKAFCGPQGIIGEDQKNLLMTIFISKLNPRLRQLLQGEESLLTFATIGVRAEELESIYGLNSGNVFSDDPEMINIIKVHEKKEKESELKLFMNQIMDQNRKAYEEQNHKMQLYQRESENRMMKMFENLNRTQSDNYNRPSSRPARNSPASEFNGVKTSLLKGYCAFEVLGGGCNRKNSCKYSHSNIPTEVRNLKK